MYGMRINIIDYADPLRYRVERLAEVIDWYTDDSWLHVTFKDGSEYGYNRQAFINFEAYHDDGEDEEG